MVSAPWPQSPRSRPRDVYSQTVVAKRDDNDSVNAFADVLTANAQFVDSFQAAATGGVARRGLAIVTCMDSRVDPLRIVGMHAGDAKILRNAGARVTDDVLRTLVLATHLLGVRRILVMPHTDCRMANSDEKAIHEEIWHKSGMDIRSVEIRTVTDQMAAIRIDVQRIRSFPLLPTGTEVLGAVYDVATGCLAPVTD